ncbi:MAG TPA: nucleotide exchange factor GrpE [Longimicrobiales bacterium]|nr:nucleotide exchange factor GrpE [Longimicrobiales bacterium]
MTEETKREAMMDPENDLENDPADAAGDPQEASAGDAPPEGRRVTPEEVEEALAEAELGGDMDALQAEFDDLNDRHLRLAAEFSNFRRRAEAESKAVWGRAQADLVRRFLDVLDDLERVALLDPEDEAVTVQSIVDGIDLVERKFLRALQDSGAEVVNPESGAAFDPETMEAMMRVSTDDEAQDDCVAQVFLKGYLVDGNLVRPARVSVYKAD